MFKKKNNQNKEKYKIDSNNLAVPEIHTGKVKLSDTEEDERKETIVYDSVAVPEVHIRKNKSTKK